MKQPILRNARSAGVTLLEVLTVIVVIAILATMLLPAFSGIISQMERSRCTANLRALYMATAIYVQDHRQWPQIPVYEDAGSSNNEYDLAWIAALKPYKISEKVWHCPTVEKVIELQQPLPSGEVRKERIDYFATPFDDKEVTPHRWPTQPWFIERGAVHGAGNLIIFTDGSVSGMDELLTKQTPK
jgi:prepilin-type N-terminal cleavage/methylation domain-containing protein